MKAPNTMKRSQHICSLAIFLNALLSPAIPSFAAAPQRITLSDILSVEPIAGTELSPDGKTIAFVRQGQIHMMSAQGGWPVAVTAGSGNKAGLSWSPDGRHLAFASGGSIWTVDTGDGQPHRLTHAAPGEGDPRQAGDRNPKWSPKGGWILFETGRRGHGSINVVNDTGTLERFLTHSNADEVDAAWSHDGTRVSYTERTPQYFSGKLNVLRFNPATAATSDPATLYTAPQDRGGGWSLRTASWSNDDSTLAITLQNDGWEHVYLVPVSGGTPRQLTHGNYEDEDPVFSPDGRSVAVVSNRKLAESSDIWIVPVSGSGEAHLLALFEEPGVANDPQWSPDGSRVFFHRSSPHNSTDLYSAAVSGAGGATALTHTLPNLFSNLQVPTRVTFKSKDGLSISGLLYSPERNQPGHPPPAVLWIHGGPEAQDVYRLDLWAQYLAGQGYSVLEPNYRGSSGYGEKFRNANVEDSGGGEMDDVAAGAEYLVSQGLADSKHLAIGGGSHGGTMVAYAVTRYPSLFQAAIEMYGVVDRATFLERTNRNSAVRWAMKMGGSPAEKPDVYARANSLAKVKGIQTPLLVLHGENDPQVPPYESAQFVKALRQSNKIYYYFTYPGELHGFSQRDHRLDAWKKELAFLERYINPQYGTSNTSVDDLLGAGLAK